MKYYSRRIVERRKIRFGVYKFVPVYECLKLANDEVKCLPYFNKGKQIKFTETSNPRIIDFIDKYPSGYVDKIECDYID